MPQALTTCCSWLGGDLDPCRHCPEDLEPGVLTTPTSLPAWPNGRGAQLPKGGFIVLQPLSTPAEQEWKAWGLALHLFLGPGLVGRILSKRAGPWSFNQMLMEVRLWQTLKI